ncbi:MAG: hypothetical protein FWE21_06365 [Defluviitaleaceae bacterium]|nr:hypothetical protein [Defluviitaleaceae bacterium]
MSKNKSIPLTDYLDIIENTEDETRFFENLDQVKDGLAEAKDIPVVGVLINALVALNDFGNVADFKDSAHYDAVEGWDITVDPATGAFSIMPGAAMRKKIFTILGVVAAGIVGIIVLIKFLRRRR